MRYFTIFFFGTVTSHYSHIVRVGEWGLVIMEFFYQRKKEPWEDAGARESWSCAVRVVATSHLSYSMWL